MDVSELRRGILRALEEARKDAATRRASFDEAGQAYEAFLRDVAVPLFRQAAIVLKAEGQLYSVHTPAGSVRLASDGAPETFVELELDSSGRSPQVLGRVSLARGRRGHVVDEAPLGEGTAVSELTERDVSEYLLRAIPKLVVKS